MAIAQVDLGEKRTSVERQLAKVDAEIRRHQERKKSLAAKAYGAGDKSAGAKLDRTNDEIRALELKREDIAGVVAEIERLEGVAAHERKLERIAELETRRDELYEAAGELHHAAIEATDALGDALQRYFGVRKHRYLLVSQLAALTEPDGENRRAVIGGENEDQARHEYGLTQRIFGRLIAAGLDLRRQNYDHEGYLLDKGRERRAVAAQRASGGSFQPSETVETPEDDKSIDSPAAEAPGPDIGAEAEMRAEHDRLEAALDAAEAAAEVPVEAGEAVDNAS